MTNQTPIERLMQWLFPTFRPFWQQFWTGMLLGTVFTLLAVTLLVVSP